MKNRIPDDSWILTKPICHRGLWGGDVPENSIKAYQLASEKCYPIEIDLYMTKDGHLVSFHDDTLKRMTGAEGFIYDKTLAELRELRLNNSEYTIPTFEEVLEIARGKSPLLIELKDQPDLTYVDKVIERLKSYDGEFAIQSFSPKIMIKVKKLAPEFIRGILGARPTKTWGLSKRTQFIIGVMPYNFLVKPDFISYFHGGLPLCKCKTKNKRVICWTIVNKEQEENALKYAENIIYENYTATKYL